MQRWFVVGLMSIVLLLCLPQAMANNKQIIPDKKSLFDDALVELSLGIELFRWQEFNGSGTRLLTEQGPRVRIRFAHTNESRLSSGLIYSLSGSLYGGDVEYDGQTQNPHVPKIETGHFSVADVDYAGLTGELLGGYRLANSFWQRSFDLLAGVGIDNWARNIGRGISSQGDAVQGLDEDYKIVFTRFAVGLENRDEFWKSLWRVGVKYPVFTKETLDVPSVELEPGKEPSLFLSYRFQLINSRGLDKGTFIYFVYDSFRFSKSPAVPTGDVLVHQPRSTMDSVSLSVGIVF